MLTEDTLNRQVLKKLNEMAEELAGMVQERGYDASFLEEKKLSAGARLEEVSDQVRNLQAALAMLHRVSYYSGGQNSR